MSEKTDRRSDRSAPSRRDLPYAEFVRSMREMYANAVYVPAREPRAER